MDKNRRETESNLAKNSPKSKLGGLMLYYRTDKTANS